MRTINREQLIKIIKEELDKVGEEETASPEALIQKLQSRVQDLEWEVSDLKKEVERIKWDLPG